MIPVEIILYFIYENKSQKFVGGDTFYKQFKKVVNSNNTINCKTQKSIKFKINNILAFSLIELSIVLIIMGLLVSGVVGGANLIETAKVQSFVNKVNNWKKDINTFYSLKGRLPGNPQNNYFIGELYSTNFTRAQTQTYKISDFGLSSYDTLSGGTTISHCGAFWLDLYLEKITDFQPTKDNIRDCNKIGKDLNIFNGDLIMRGPLTMNFNSNNGTWKSFYNPMKGIYFQFVDITPDIKPRILYKLDRKIDDALYDDGYMRSFCYSNGATHNKNTQVDYQTAIDKGYTCNDFYYKLIDYDML